MICLIYIEIACNICVEGTASMPYYCYKPYYMKTKIIWLFILLVFPFINVVFAQTPDTTALKDVGVAVSPSHINFNLKPGESKTYEVKVINETLIKRSFSTTLKDFDMNNAGKTSFSDSGSSKYGMSNWLSIAPTFFDLKPGEVQKVRITLSIPDTGFSNRAAWSILLIEEKKQREALDNEGSDKKISLGVVPSFGFGVYLYQNPPTVQNNKVEIKNFKLQTGKEKKQRNIEITLQNMGDGIASCVSYIELTNQSTGKQQKLMVKRFVVLPGYTRNYLFSLPENLEKGKYSAVGVLDYGSKDLVEAAELEFLVD